MIQDNASFTFLHRIADVDRRKSRHLSKVLLGDVSLVAELLKPPRKDVCVELHIDLPLKQATEGLPVCFFSHYAVSGS